MSGRSALGAHPGPDGASVLAANPKTNPLHSLAATLTKWADRLQCALQGGLTTLQEVRFSKLNDEAARIAVLVLERQPPGLYCRFPHSLFGRLFCQRLAAETCPG